MSLKQVWKRSKDKNKSAYRQFCFCISFAVLLITSYIMMLESPLIQQTLPEGGDSRKQVYMIFVLAAAGCVIFTVYAASLFLRYKSREIGVFLALGTEKGKVKALLLREISGYTAAMIGAGLVAGCLVSLCLGILFEHLVKGLSEYSFAFTGIGFGASLLYGLFILAMLLILSAHFMKRSNIMDILNEQRKQEPLKRMVSPPYLIGGILLFAGGLLLAFVMPAAVAKMTGHYMGAWTNLFYLTALAGLYRIMVYSISCHRKGRRPQKYYNNLISYGMLKFQGSSFVRNMLVVTLLLAGGIFAAFYVPINGQENSSSLARYESMYSMFYTGDAAVPSQKEIANLAQTYGVELQQYRKAQVLQVVGSGVNRDDVDEKGNLKEVYEKQHALYEIFSAGDYEKLTGQKAEPQPGTYYLIQSPGAQEDLFFRFDDIDSLYLDKWEKFMPLAYGKTVTYQSLVQGWGFDHQARLVVSDADFQKIKEGTEAFPRETQVLFNSKGGDSLAFAEELYLRFGQGCSADMKVCNGYDAWQHKLQGNEYDYAGKVRYDPANSVKEADWQYEPLFLPLKEAGGMKRYAVYLLLFVYVSIICLAAAGVISYSRSQSIALGSSQVFSDLEKLGADAAYQRKLLAKQLKKVFLLPTLLGGFGMTAFGCLMLKTNDGVLSAGEIKTIGIFFVILLAVMAYQYGIYRFSRKKAQSLLGL
ncbi:MAG: hypothetical protein HFE76_01620 [Firmicutes bacterium]|nr:hypothetical protein [Bacillota bacterium]